MPCRADLFANHTIAIDRGVKDDGTELAEVDMAIRQDAFICLFRDDLADQQAMLLVEELDCALERERIFLNHRGIDMGALVDMDANLLDLVQLVSLGNAEIVRDLGSVCRCKENREGAFGLEILGVLCVPRKKAIFPSPHCTPQVAFIAFGTPFSS